MKISFKGFQIYEYQNYVPNTVSIMGWLHMLFVYCRIKNETIQGGMYEKDWKNDNRMGITFGEAVKELETKGYAILEDKWKITELGEKALIEFFKVPKTRDEWLEYDSSWLKEYDTKDYRISDIPTDIFERKFKKAEANMQYTLSQLEYYKLSEWWVKFQRGRVGWWTQLNKYLGLRNELIPDVSKMVLYRGLHFDLYYNSYYRCITDRGEINPANLKIGDRLVCNKPSWSLDREIARMFASGKQGYGDSRKMCVDEMGVVLKNVFPSAELLLDTDWVVNNKYLSGEQVLPQEMEVIVRPRKRFVEVVEIFDSTNAPM